MQNKIRKIFEDSIGVKNKVLNSLMDEIEQGVKLISSSLKSCNKILICGNGGSAADSQHFAAELVVRFLKERKSLPSIALTTDTSILTACGNDYGFENIFSKQVEGLGNKGDVLIGITTSGNSPNILKAFEIAKKKGLETICLSGNSGCTSSVNLDITIPSKITARIQESHETILHAWCELIDDEY